MNDQLRRALELIASHPPRDGVQPDPDVCSFCHGSGWVETVKPGTFDRCARGCRVKKSEDPPKNEVFT